jgi:hypothetical protein
MSRVPASKGDGKEPETNNPAFSMSIQLIKGHYSQTDALELLTVLVHVTIKFHENKIGKSHNMDAIKHREQQIKKLQQDFYEAKQAILSKGKNCVLISDIKII